MEEDKEICYPYAYGRLNAGLEWVVSNLKMDCMDKDIEVDERVIKLLEDNIKKLQKIAVTESYSHLRK